MSIFQKDRYTQLLLESFFIWVRGLGLNFNIKILVHNIYLNVEIIISMMRNISTMNRFRISVILLFLILLPLNLPVAKADQPCRVNWVHFVDGDPSTGMWIVQETGTVWETDVVGVYRISGAFTYGFVGPDDAWTLNYHYVGTSKSKYFLSRSYFLTGVMQYNIHYEVFASPHEGNDWDGQWRVWFENGQIVRQEGKGCLWFPS